MVRRWKHALLGVALVMVTGQQVMAENPEAVKLYNQGLDTYMNGRSQQALALFEQAIQIDAHYADAYYNIGSIHYQNGQYEKAKEAFAKALQINPNDNQAKYNLGLSHEKLGQYKQAYDFMAQIPVSDKKYADARKRLEDLKPRLASLPQAAPSASKSPAQVEATKTVEQMLQQLSQQGALQPQSEKAQTVLDTDVKLTVKTFAKGFSGPTGMTIGPGGYMYVANYSKNTIYKVGANGEKLVFVEGEGLNGPIGLTFNSKTGELYVANYLKNNIVRVTAEGEVSILASGLNKPYNLFLDAVNNDLYVSEQETNSVSKIALP